MRAHSGDQGRHAGYSRVHRAHQDVLKKQFVKTDHAAFTGFRPTGCGDLDPCHRRPLRVRRLPRAQHLHVSGLLGYLLFGGFLFPTVPGFFCSRFVPLWAMP